MAIRRNEKGHWLPGQSGNENTYRAEAKAMLKTVVGPEEWVNIAERALKDALKGDRWARQWLSDYLLGKALQPHHFSTDNQPVSLEDWMSRAAERTEEVKCLES